MKATINGIQLAYTDEGRGTPIVFLHAFPLNRTMWEPQVRALSGQFRVITVDLRGHGESDAQLWNFPLSLYADDVHGLLDHLKIARAVLVGLSMGGYVLFAFYRQYPQQAQALILADTRAQADTEEGREGRRIMAQAALAQGHAPVTDTMLPKLLSQESRDGRPELVARVTGMITSTPISGIIVDCMAMADRPDFVPLLTEIACPTLVVVGDKDQATPPADARTIAEGIKGAKLETIAGAAHLSNLEQPEAFNRAVADFVGSLK